jgi:peptidylprolyl isomerase
MRKLKQKEWFAVIVGLILVFYLHTPLESIGEGDVLDSPLGNLDELVAAGSSSLQVHDVTEGTGAAAEQGQMLTVHYVGRLTSGQVFDSSIERDRPFVFELGAGDVIQGWDRGLLGMREGGRRILVIPPELGYGSRGTGNIPPNSTLIFEVVLLDVNGR